MRVLVVRAAHQAEATAAALVAAGHEPVVAPILSMKPTDAPVPSWATDALIVTSRNAVGALARHRTRFRGIPVFAVGPRTAASLAEVGFDDVVAGSGDAADLARTVEGTMPGGTRLLHVAGRERRPEPARSLAAAGYRVETWEAYAAEPVQRLPSEARNALATGEIDAVLHYSPRSAALLARLTTEAGLVAGFARLRHLCLSANVAAALAPIATDRIAIAASPQEERLLALLDKLGRTD